MWDDVWFVILLLIKCGLVIRKCTVTKEEWLNIIELTHDKTNKMICPVWSESSLYTQWITKDPRFLHADSKDWSDWADALVDLSRRWAHRSFCWFYHETAQLKHSGPGFLKKNLVITMWIHHTTICDMQLLWNSFIYSKTLKTLRWVNIEYLWCYIRYLSKLHIFEKGIVSAIALVNSD